MEDAPSADSLTVQVAYVRRERLAAEREAASRGPLLRRPAVIWPVAAAGGLTIAVTPVLLQRFFHLTLSAPASILGSALVIAVSFLTLRSLGRAREEIARHEQHPDEYMLSDAGLEISGVDDLALLSWSSMTRVHETDRFFLFLAGGEVQYLPKRVLDATQEAQVRGLIARHRRASGRSLPPASHA